MVLVSSLLLTRYYRLRGNPTGALIQVRNGLGLLNQWDRWQCTTGQRSDACLPNCVARVSSIWYPFVRHYMELLDSPLHLAAASQMLPISPPEISNSRPFKSVDEVFKEMLAILMSLRYSCGSNILVPVLIPNYQQHRRSHRKLYEAWKWNFAEYRHSAQFGSDDPFGQTNFWGIRLKILKMYEQCVYMSTNLDPSKGNLAWDELSHHFERIVAFAEDIIDTERRLNAYETFPAKSLMYMIPNLGNLLQVICSVVRDRAILGRALVLLKQHAYRSGFFGSAFVAQLLETKAEAEQIWWHEARMKGSCEYIPGSFICSFHRVDYIAASEEPCSIAGYVAVTMTTRQDTDQGMRGQRHLVPCFGDTGIDKFA